MNQIKDNSECSFRTCNDDKSLFFSWLIYENEQYNADGGDMLWMEGIRGCMNIDDMDNKVSTHGVNESIGGSTGRLGEGRFGEGTQYREPQI